MSNALPLMVPVEVERPGSGPTWDEGLDAKLSRAPERERLQRNRRHLRRGVLVAEDDFDGQFHLPGRDRGPFLFFSFCCVWPGSSGGASVTKNLDGVGFAGEGGLRRPADRELDVADLLVKVRRSRQAAAATIHIASRAAASTENVVASLLLSFEVSRPPGWTAAGSDRLQEERRRTSDRPRRVERAAEPRASTSRRPDRRHGRRVVGSEESPDRLAHSIQASR